MLHARLRAAAGNRGGIPTDGLIAWYTMDSISGSTLVDEMGNHDGAISGATSSLGVVGDALAFDGVNDYVNLGPSADFSNAEYCISAWINSSDQSANQSILGNDQSDPTDNRVFQFRANTSGSLQLIVFDGSDSVIGSDSSVADVVDGTWRHVVANVRSGAVDYYIGGTLDSTFALSGTPNTSTGDRVYIGARYRTTNGVTDFFNGSIDALRFYTRSLSPAEITELYNEGA